MIADINAGTNAGIIADEKPIEVDPRLPKALMPTAGVLAQLDAEDRRRLDRIFIEPIEYQKHPSFSKAGTAKELFGTAVGGELAPKSWCNSAESKQQLSDSVLHQKTLTGSQEMRLFLRHNYSRYRLARLLDAFAQKRLTARATQELLWWHKQTAMSRSEIVQANLPLVLAMAKRTRLGNIVDYAELISEGNMALLRSVDKFDCSRGFKFSTYACRAILKSFSRVAMRSSRYRGRFPIDFDPALEKSDYLEQQRESVEAGCVEQLRGMLTRNTAELNEVEVKVLQARFALNQALGTMPDSPKTLEQVGLLIGVTKERVRQIQNRALLKLREKMQEDFLAA